MRVCKMCPCLPVSMNRLAYYKFTRMNASFYVFAEEVIKLSTNTMLIKIIENALLNIKSMAENCFNDLLDKICNLMR